uniref:Si:ch73-173p19.1 n=1 Tax=Salmo trutta TaxID=8032 RepID=A0A673YPN4_SALTR
KTPGTIGELFRTLCEMGFSEEQIQSALQAGHFSVPDAAEWLLQGENLRHKLVKNPSQPVGTPFAAFNPPKDAGSSFPPSPALVLGPPQPSSPSTDTPPLESRIRQDKSDFQEQQRMRVANEARNERRQKKQERELVLKRIAEDRRSLQEKTQPSTPTETMSPPDSSQGQRLGGTVQTSVEHNCILMIRLPSGESMRERFPADAPLRSVVEHISGRHPSLASFSLLQGFPRKRFGEAELACSLRSLGLMPNAALCIQTTPPETPLDPPSPAAHLLLGQEEGVVPPPAPPQPQIPVLEEGGMEDPALPPPLPHLLWEEAVGYAGIPGVGPPVTGPSHSWGRGQKLNPGDAEEAASSEDEELPEEGGEPPFPFNGMPRLPFFPENRMEPRHHWPDQGNRLREGVVGDPAVEPEEVAGRMVPGAAGQAAVERLQRAAQDDPQASQGHPSPPKRPFRTPSVPSLCVMATRATVNLMTAPSMQYSSSLSCLTPELAELLLSHMSRERLLRPRTLELFFGCPMQKFVLNCYPYSTNELLRQLRAFTALKHLSLVNSPLITDTGLSVLCSLLKLQHLNLTSCSKLTDSCLQHITGLKSLSFLSLDQTKVSDVGMVLYLQSAPSSLTQLSLNQTSVTEATLAALPACVPQLRLLSVKHTKVRDVSALAALPSLQTLYLDGTGVREGSLECLAIHSTLSALSLAGISVADGNHALQIISGLRLTQLTLPGRHSVTDAGLTFLSRLSLLSELDLTDYTHVTDHGVTQLATMTRLKRLSLSNTQVTDMGLPSLCSLQELLELCLDRTAVTSRGVAALVTCLPHLQVLSLASTQVGDTVVRRGLVHCAQLFKLNLSRTRITDHGLKFLKRMRLSQVNLEGSGVTPSGISNLIASCPHITSIRASHTRAIPPDQVSDDDDNQ